MYDVSVDAVTFSSEFIARLATEPDDFRVIRIFDFDDTLVFTGSTVTLFSKGGMKRLTPAEFASYDKRPGDTFDFSSFEHLIDPIAITWTNDMLKACIERHGQHSVAVLSARTSARPIKQYLDEQGLSVGRIAALNDARAESKARWIESLVHTLKPELIEVFDDSPRVVNKVNALNEVHKDTTFNAFHVVHTDPPRDGTVILKVDDGDLSSVIASTWVMSSHR